MTPDNSDTSEGSESSSPSVLDDFLKVLGESGTVDLEAWTVRHPQHASALHSAWSNWNLAARAIDRAAATNPAETSRPHSIGDVIGDYRLVRLLGRGGQGSVWEAEQDSLRRRVALKLIRQDRVGEQSELLLQREARAGGRLSHPGIVAVHAWGESDGVHWIAQELVPGGQTLYDWIALQRELRSAETNYYVQCAEQVASICDALSAAHSNGIIHRDVKPLNILLAPDGQPKLTDFGLARVSDEADLSVSGDVLGTYSYMSPEQIQASRRQLDARTDIFSLGVVMYEMLSLRRPFEGDTSHQIAHKILFQDAPDLLASRSRIPKDLAVICGKALEKNSGQRYAGMDEFAADLRRWLANEPIHASPPGTLRRVGKWMQRNPAKSVAVAMGVTSLAVVSLFLLDKTTANRKLETQAVQLEEAIDELEDTQQNLLASKADLETQAVQLATTIDELEGTQQDLLASKADLEDQVEDTLAITGYQTKMLTGIRPYDMGVQIPEVIEERLIARGVAADEAESRARAVEEVLLRANATDVASELLGRTLFAPAAEGLHETLGDRPPMEASLHYALGESYRQLGLSEPALEQFQASHQLRMEALGPHDELTLTSLMAAAGALRLLSRFDEASASFSEVIAGWRALSDEGSGELSVAVFGQAVCMLKTGRTAEALALTEEALEMAEEHLGEGAKQTLQIRESYGATLAALRRFPESESVLLRAQELGEAFEEGNSVRSAIDNSLGLMYMHQGKFAEAAPPLSRALESHRRHRGTTHPDTLTAMDNLAQAYQRLGRDDEAEVLMREALAAQRLTLGNSSYRTWGTMKNLGTFLLQRGRTEEAGPFLKEAYEHASRAPDTLPPALYTRLAYGVFLFREGDEQAAWEVLQPAAGTFEDALGLKHPHTRSCLSHAARVAAAVGEWAEAERMGRLCLESLEFDSNPNIEAALAHLFPLLTALRRQGELEAAEVTAQQIVTIAEQHPGEGSQALMNAHLHHASVLLERKDVVRAGEQLDKATVLVEASATPLPAELKQEWTELRTQLGEAAAQAD